MKIPRTRFWQKLIITFIIILCSLLFAAPRIARAYLVSNAESLIGRKVEVDKIRVNYFTGLTRVETFTLYEKDSLVPFISFGKLEVNLDYLPLFRNEFHFKRIELDNLRAKVYQNESQFNFSDLLMDTDSSEANAAIDTAGKESLRIVVGHIELNNGFISYTDLILDHTVEMDTLDIKIPGFAWDASSTNLDLEFDLLTGGSISTNLVHQQTDSSYLVKLKIDSLNLNVFEPYAKEYIFINALEGYYSNDLLVRGSLRHLTHIAISGRQLIDGLIISDTMDREVFTFESFDIVIDSFNLQKRILDLDYIHLWNPSIYLELIDTTNNFARMIKLPVQEDTIIKNKTNQPTKDSTFTFGIKEIAMAGGLVLFQDGTLNKPFQYQLQNIEIQTDEMGNSLQTQVNIQADLNNTGAVKSKVRFNPADISEVFFELSVMQFRIKDLDPYLEYYFALNAEEGLLNFRTENELYPELISSANNLYMRQVSLEDTEGVEPEVNVPLKLALGLLSDKDGVVDLNVPVEVKGEETEIGNLGKIIFRAIGNVFLKAALSPYNLLAGMYDVDPEKIKQFEVGVLKSMPDDDNMETMDLLAEILSDKPGLKAELLYTSDSAFIVDTLAEILTTNKLFPEESKRSNLTDSIVFQTLLEQTNLDTTTGKHENFSYYFREYIGQNTLAYKFDSIQNAQVDFVNEYLQFDKMLDSSSYEIVYETPDTLEPTRQGTRFLIFFTAADAPSQVSDTIE